MIDPIKILQDLIRIPSHSREETAAADYLESVLEEAGFHPQRHQNNLWCVSPYFDNRQPTLLLNAHIDTVKPAQGWQDSPYEPILKDGHLQGLGSSDCGGGLVSLLAAFAQLREKPQPYNLIYLAPAEEEVSGVNGISSVLPLLPKIDVAIVGEPTSLQPAIAERGLMVLDCTAKGRAGHAARNEGINALYKALDDIEWIRSHQFERVSELLGPVKMTATIIQAGTLHNCIPDTCTFTVDVRVNELYTNQQVLEEIQSHLTSDVRARSTRLGSSRISLRHPLIRAAQALGLQPFGSPTLSDQALMPFPSFKLGPGDSALSHTAQEHIRLQSIDEAIHLYLTLLDGRDIRFDE